MGFIKKAVYFCLGLFITGPLAVLATVYVLSLWCTVILLTNVGAEAADFTVWIDIFIDSLMMVACWYATWKLFKKSFRKEIAI
jgi:hypothetical protein